MKAKAIFLAGTFFCGIYGAVSQPCPVFSNAFTGAFEAEKKWIDETCAAYNTLLTADSARFMALWVKQISAYTSKDRKTHEDAMVILENFLYRMSVLPQQIPAWQDLFCQTIGVNIAKVMIVFIISVDPEDFTFQELAVINDLFIVFGLFKDPVARYCMVPGLKIIIEREWGFGLDFIIILFQEQLKDYINVCKTFGIHKDFCF